MSSPTAALASAKYEMICRSERSVAGGPIITPAAPLSITACANPRRYWISSG
ncbi:hypothetical protein [Amycolatopsis ultiminotia]|uniref:hypothetical protein n=1 Tax=Amycolatopsis ultiminotia TaxID=543629 RepID=UPI0031EE9D37